MVPTHALMESVSANLQEFLPPIGVPDDPELCRINVACAVMTAHDATNVIYGLFIKISLLQDSPCYRRTFYFLESRGRGTMFSFRLPDADVV